MQSQLAAALLGQSGGNPTPDDEEKDEVEEEADDIDEDIIDEENELEADSRAKASTASTSRTITLQMLLEAGILQPGNGTMSIEYLGQRFIGDLLLDGKIKSQETDLIFASPSAWAIHCKRIINPDKKSGCGWASVKYKGRKLDAYKNTWFKRKQQEELDNREEDAIDAEMEAEMERIEAKLLATPAPLHRVVMKHNTVPNRAFTHDGNTLIECIPFSTLGKIQPFLISFSTNACLLMDFHCHLTTSEVHGYLAGQWDVNAHNLSITHAFPCRVLKADRLELGPQIEKEIQEAMEQQKLTLVGWYHSHPTMAAAPTYRDIDSQLEYQIKMKGNCDSTYIPCTGVICSPYNPENSSLESNIISYWVIPPSETKPNEYGRPMLMSYSVVQDSVVTSTVMDEMKKCADFYRKGKDFIKFNEKYNDKATYLEKLKTTLSCKFPRDQSETVLWGFIRELVGCPGEEKVDTSVLLTIPKVPPPTSSSTSSSSIILEPPKISTPSATSTSTSTPQITSLPSNLMLTTDLASVLFQSGKFPSALLGLPDPMSRQTLAANNMFLTPSLFKMQDTINLLKPLSTSSPLASTSKLSDLNLGPSIKIPSDITLIKPPKLDYSITSDSKISKLEISPSDFSISKPKIDFSASDLSISSVKPTKIDFSASDLSISSAKSTTDIFNQMLDMSTKNKSDFSVADLTGLSPAKIAKTDFPSLNLSLIPTKVNTAQSDISTGPNDLSMLSTSSQSQSIELSQEEQVKPMSLTISSDDKN